MVVLHYRMRRNRTLQHYWPASWHDLCQSVKASTRSNAALDARLWPVESRPLRNIRYDML